MSDTESTTDAIRDNIEGPKRATGDTGSVEQHSPGDQADADRYLASKTAAKIAHRGIRFTKLVPSSAAE